MVLTLYFGRWRLFLLVAALQLAAFVYYGYGVSRDPSYSHSLALKRHGFPALPNWQHDLATLTPDAKLNQVLRYAIRKEQNQRIESYAKGLNPIPTLWQIDRYNEETRLKSAQELLAHSKEPKTIAQAQATIDYITQRRAWMESQIPQLHYLVMCWRPFHWEEDAGGSEALNRLVDWLDLTRVNRKDLTAALIFGVRISLTVGLISIALALLIGIPVKGPAIMAGRSILLCAGCLRFGSRCPPSLCC